MFDNDSAIFFTIDLDAVSAVCASCESTSELRIIQALIEADQTARWWIFCRPCYEAGVETRPYQN